MVIHLNEPSLHELALKNLSAWAIKIPAWADAKYHSLICSLSPHLMVTYLIQYWLGSPCTESREGSMMALTLFRLISLSISVIVIYKTHPGIWTRRTRHMLDTSI